MTVEPMCTPIRLAGIDHKLVWSDVDQAVLVERKIETALQRAEQLVVEIRWMEEYYVTSKCDPSMVAHCVHGILTELVEIPACIVWYRVGTEWKNLNCWVKASFPAKGEVSDD